MAPVIENIDDRKLSYSPSGKIRVRRFTPSTNEDFIVDDGTGRRPYVAFSRSTTVGITDAPEAFYGGVLAGGVLSFDQGQNLYVRNGANVEVIVVNLV